MKSGNILFKAFCICLIPIVIIGSLITIIGTLIKSLGLFIMLDKSGAIDEMSLINRVIKKYKF